jgi:hypothetical protein
MPQYDDRPGQGSTTSGGTQRPGTTNPTTPSSPGTATPGYGDQEPGDPRRLDVDAGKGGRSQSGDTTNRS